MELKRGYNLSQLWADTLDDIQRVAAVAASKPTAQPPESVFLNVLGTSEPIRAPPQTGSHSQRATEEYEKSICENKAFAIFKIRVRLERWKSSKKDGGEMLVAIAQTNRWLMQHLVLAQMVNPDVRDDLPISEFATVSSASGSSRTRNLMSQTKLFPCILQKVLWQMLRWTAHYALYCSVELPGSMSFAYALTCMGVRIVASDSQKTSKKISEALSLVALENCHYACKRQT